jgi:hypothetical protein
MSTENRTNGGWEWKRTRKRKKNAKIKRKIRII